MEPVPPTTVPSGFRRLTYATEQPQYEPLPAVRNERGLVMTEWRPSPDELTALLNGGLVRVWCHTFNQPLQPLRVEASGPAFHVERS